MTEFTLAVVAGYLRSALLGLHARASAFLGWLHTSSTARGVSSAMDAVKSAVVAFLTSAAFQGILTMFAADLAGLAIALPWYLHYPLLLAAAVVSFAANYLKLRSDGPAA